MYFPQLLERQKYQKWKSGRHICMWNFTKMLAVLNYIRTNDKNSKQTIRKIYIDHACMSISHSQQARNQDFGEEGTRIWVPASKGGSGVSPQKILKTYMRFGAMYCIWCTKIIDLANFKVMFKKIIKFAPVKNILEIKITIIIS